MALTINPQLLKPASWSRNSFNAPSEEDLIFVGLKNLERLMQYWKREEITMAWYIESAQVEVDMLDGKTIEDIKSMAAKYEHPDFPKIGLLDDCYWCKEPAPLDEASKYRKGGATTFNFCGWCKYCEEGIRHYNCRITTACSLIPEEAGDNDEILRFNTPCLIVNGTEELLKACAEYSKSKLAFYNARKAMFDKYIKLIEKAAKKTEEKPAFTDFRTASYFEIGDEVVYYISNDHENTTKKGVFVTGKIVDGPDHGHGKVRVRTDERIYADKDGNEGRVVDLALWSPEVIHKWEYEYLKTHPEFLEIWIKETLYRIKLDSHGLTEAFSKSDI